MGLELLPAELRSPCSQCGNCCKDFGNGKERGLPLLPPEFRKFKETADERGIRLPHTKKILFSDKKTKKNLVFEYRVLTEPCIFYDEEKGCTIYDERPLVCRAYPYMMEFDENEKEQIFFSKCTELDKFKQRFLKLKEHKLGRQDEQLMAARAYQYTAQFYQKMLYRMDKSGKARVYKKISAWEDRDADLFVWGGASPINSSREIIDFFMKPRDK